MPLSRSASPFFDRLFWRPAIRFLVPLSRSAASYSDRLFWRPAIQFPVPLSRSAPSPSDRLFYRPDIRFRCPSPAPPRLFLTGYFDAQVSLFRYPRAFFSLPVLVSLIVFFDALLVPTQPSLPGYFGGRLALCAALRFACGFYRSAVFTAPRFLLLHGFYRSMVFTAPLSPVFFGGSALPPPSCLLPPSLQPLPGGSLLVPPCGSPAIFTAPRFFSAPRFFTAPRFLPLRGFYRSAVFTAPRFFTAPLSPVLWRALLFRRPRACCPPVFTHFRAARSLVHLAVRLRFLPLRDFYRSAVFPAPRFLPLRGFYRSAVFTAPRFLPLRAFLPLRDFYRSALAGSLGGSALPCCPPVFALFRAHPVLPAHP